MVLTSNSLHLLVLLLCYLLTLVTKTDSADILGIFPTASYSHQQPLLSLSRALAEKGHNLTIITTNPHQKPIKNLREIDLSSLHEDWKEMQRSGVMNFQTRMGPFKLFSNICGYSKFIAGAVLKKPVFKSFLKEINGTKYDLILYEALGYSSLLAVRELVGNPPVVGLVTLHTMNIIDDPYGNPCLASQVPVIFLRHDDKMSFWERFQNLIANLYSRYIFHYCMLPAHQEYINSHFSNGIKRTAEELEFDKSLLIVSSDLATGYAKPLQPNTVYVGPLQIYKNPEPLPKDLQKWMDEAEDGVIYFSLGSNMKSTSMPENIRAEFIKAFKKLPKIKVIWKWESDTELSGQPTNVLVRKWLPQRSILAHPKVKVFISQVGLQSFQEAIEHAVPVLGIPMFGDQDYNAFKLLQSGAGLSMEFNDLSCNDIYEKLKMLITDPVYKNNMIRLSSITKDKPMSAIDTAIWWVEYIIRHNGAPHLRPASIDLTWYQYCMLDVLAVVLISVLIILYATLYVLKRLTSFILNFLKNKSVKLKSK